MKKTIFYSTIILILMSGCTQIVTAPIKIAGATAGAAIDVAGSAVGAVAGSDDEEKEK
jgi:uncharacterized protein YceK